MVKYDDDYFEEKFNKINYYKNILIIESNLHGYDYIRGQLRLLIDELFEGIEFNKLSRIEEFTLEELALYDGKEGRLAYVAIKGTVYDVTSPNFWINGMHAGHKAGSDLTKVYEQTHKDSGILEKLRIVGVLKDK